MTAQSANRMLLVSVIIAVAFPTGVFIWQKQIPFPDASEQSVLGIQEQPNTTKTAPSIATVEPTYNAEPNGAIQKAPHTVASTPPETEHPVVPRSTDDGGEKNPSPSSEANASSALDEARKAEILEIQARKAELLEIAKKHQASQAAAMARFKEVLTQLADMLAEYPIEQRRELLTQAESRLKELLPAELVKQSRDMLITALREKGIEIE